MNIGCASILFCIHTQILMIVTQETAVEMEIALTWWVAMNARVMRASLAKTVKVGTGILRKGIFSQRNVSIFCTQKLVYNI